MEPESLPAKKEEDPQPTEKGQEGKVVLKRRSKRLEEGPQVKRGGAGAKATNSAKTDSTKKRGETDTENKRKKCKSRARKTSFPPEFGGPEILKLGWAGNFRVSENLLHKPRSGELSETLVRGRWGNKRGSESRARKP